MNISLTPELERMVQEKVQGGLYTSASEVIRESLRLMHMYESLKKQRIMQLNQAIDAGLEDLHQGKHIDGEVSRKKMRKKINEIASRKK